MHVLVTGGLGHIGSQLIRYLSDNSRIRAITILDNLSTQRYASLFDLPKNLEYTFVKGDILDSIDILSILKSIELDRVI